jgi:thiamine monophosphate kinase
MLESAEAVRPGLVRTASDRLKVAGLAISAVANALIDACDHIAEELTQLCDAVGLRAQAKASFEQVL